MEHDAKTYRRIPPAQQVCLRVKKEEGIIRSRRVRRYLRADGREAGWA